MQSCMRTVFQLSEGLIAIDFFVSPIFTWMIGIVIALNILGILIVTYREFRDR